MPERTRRRGAGGPVDGAREEPFISNGRLAVIALIASESMLFSGLIGSFLIFKLSAPFWPPPGLPRLPLLVTLLNSVVLLASAATMALAVRSVRRTRNSHYARVLALTLALGATFLIVQGSEWVRLVSHGLRLSTGTYGATFYAIIGCHALHVLGAVIWLAFVLVAARGGRYDQRNHGTVEACALYWYFVCLIWPLLFVLVYL